MYVAGDEDCYWIWPGYRCVLVPPPLHDDRNVEAENERQRDEVTVRVTVLRHTLKYPEEKMIHLKRYFESGLAEDFFKFQYFFYHR